MNVSSCCSGGSCSVGVEKERPCPENGKMGRAVASKTILHHLRTPWRREVPEQAYWFCDDPDCDVVYFGADGTLFRRGDLRTEVGCKLRGDDRLICYCFDVRATDIIEPEGLKACRDYVIHKTRDSACDCEIRNPSGRCCLADFPKPKK